MTQQPKSLIDDSDLIKILKINKEAEKWLIPPVKRIPKINNINRIYSEITSINGLDFIDSVLKRLKIKYSTDEDFDRLIPKSGPFIIVANHPWGGVEGMVLLKLICEIRPDFKFQGSFLLHQIKPIEEYIIPVNPFERFKSAKSSYTGLKQSFEHLSEGKCLGIFPAGEVSSFRLRDFKITDRQWQKSSIKFIQKAGVPVIPVYLKGYNSSAFHFLGGIHPLLRTAKLPSEILNKSHKKLKIEIRKPISPKIIKKFTSVSSLTHYLRAKTYTPSDGTIIEKIFKSKPYTKIYPPEEIIDRVEISLLKSDIKKLSKDKILFSQGGFSVFCVTFQDIPNLINEIGRLREITFREIGEGTNKSLDIDKFDLHYNHLLLWDNNKQQLAGSYRIGKGSDILDNFGGKGFYISTLFKIKKDLDPVLRESLELGRSFIVKEYQRLPLSLALLWKGIFILLNKFPSYQYLIGPVSISDDYSSKSKSIIVQYIERNHFDSTFSALCRPRKKFKIPAKMYLSNNIIISGIENSLQAIDLYINDIEKLHSVPVLLKKYLQMNGKVIGFNVDQDFKNCLDALIIVKISDIPVRLLENLSKNLDESQIIDRYKTTPALIG
jgi:putative hemolysin